MNIIKRIHRQFAVLLVCISVVSCEKIDIAFATTSTGTDPNITYFDNYRVNFATYKLDSFLTSGHSIFSIGYHTDPVFGIVKAGSFAQLNLPSSNSLANTNVSFDSLELILKPNGEFYGDSALPFTVKVYQLTENIKDDVNGDSYYNTRSFAYNPAAIGQQTVSLYGKTGKEVHIKLSATLGQELLNKFKTSDDAISSADNFINYFKGIYITADSANTKSVAYFNAASDSLIRLHYHENGLIAESKVLNFGFTSTKQFNNITFRNTNSRLAAFVNNKKQLIPSTSSGNQSFLNANWGAAIKVSFPDLLNLKELHPYVKVVKAVLVIKPDTSSYTFPYQLKSSLYLYQTDNTNDPGTGIYSTSTTSQTLQSGDLAIDQIYGENTYYSYDITQFINTKIAEGQFSQSALLVYNSLSSSDAGIQRLILNDQTKNSSIQLKLFVLGL